MHYSGVEKHYFTGPGIMHPKPFTASPRNPHGKSNKITRRFRITKFYPLF